VGVGFGPTNPCGLAVFEAAALDHYATPPFQTVGQNGMKSEKSDVLILPITLIPLIFLKFASPAGIEPTSQIPQTWGLSFSLRGLKSQGIIQ
jgi:hypothetical protein